MYKQTISKIERFSGTIFPHHENIISVSFLPRITRHLSFLTLLTTEIQFYLVFSQVLLQISLINGNEEVQYVSVATETV